MQCAYATLSTVACPAVQYFFPHYLINGTIFEKKKIIELKSVFRVSLQLLSEKNFILRTERVIIKNIF